MKQNQNATITKREGEMPEMTESQLVLILEPYVNNHLQAPGVAAITDFHTVLKRRAVTQFNFAAGGASVGTGVVGVLCGCLIATVSAVAAAVAVPIGVLVHQHYQGAVERNVDTLQTMWLNWYRIRYCGGYSSAVTTEVRQFASRTHRQTPSLMNTDHRAALERSFLEQVGVPCQRYLYALVWNHVAYNWDLACSHQARGAIQGSALQGPNGILMPRRDLGRRDAYGTPLQSATDAETSRAAHTAMPGERDRMGISNPLPRL